MTRFRYSIRTVFAVLLVSSVVLATHNLWIRNGSRQLDHEYALLDDLHAVSLYGNIETEFGNILPDWAKPLAGSRYGDFERVVEVDLTMDNLNRYSPVYLSHFRRFKHLKTIKLGQTMVKPEIADLMRTFTSLEKIEVWNWISVEPNNDCVDLTTANFPGITITKMP